MKFIELSHRIVDGIITFHGNYPVKIDVFMDKKMTAEVYGEKEQSMLDKIEMVNISGTYIDSPLHRYDHGNCVADIPLEKCAHLD